MDTSKTPSAASLRERKKAQTRQSLQQQALRLFLSKGYEATTVEEISSAAGVSHMTFFRYFPSKEDVIMSDDYDPLLFEAITARPPSEPPIEKVRRALGESLALVYAADREALLARTRLILGAPPLRARLWEQQLATERLIARALAVPSGDDGSEMRIRVLASACLSAINTAVLMWAENDGAEELPDLIDQALTTLRKELCQTDE